MGNLIFNNSSKFSFTFFNCKLDKSEKVGDSYIFLCFKPPCAVSSFKALFSKDLKKRLFPFILLE